MFVINGFTRRMVEGLGDEEVPGWLAPHVRDFAALARSSAVLEAKNNAALQRLAQRISEIARVARVAAHMKGNEGLAGGVNSALTAEIDEFCGTPPHPHRLDQAALAVALIASSLEAKDPAKAALVAQAERLQGLKGPADSGHRSLARSPVNGCMADCGAFTWLSHVNCPTIG